MDEITRRRPPQPGRLSRAALGRLKQPLPPELVSERTTEHGEVLRYIEGWRAIEQANAVFGHDRWGAELVGEVTAAVTDALKRALRHFGERFGNGLGAVEGGSVLAPSAVEPDELRRRVLAIAASAGADEARTRAWVEQRYGRPLAQLDAQALLACVDALSRGLHRRSGQRAA